MLFLDPTARQLLVAHALGGFPDEACGFLVGSVGADRVNDEHGWLTVGVAHSHTHSEAWPSPTDVEDADNPMLDPGWHYVIVSLRDATPVVRSFLLADRTIREEQVIVGAGKGSTALPG
jgi:proteasome lid subunit RPN8/RPN11